jgi:Na+-driven multidrug efflux pump
MVLIKKGNNEVSFIQNIRTSFKKMTAPYPWRFVGFMLLVFLVPKLYDLSNVYWIGKISFEALAITEQYEFLSITIEVVNETIPFGVLALVAQNFADKDKVLRVLKAGLFLQLCFSIGFMLVIVALTPQFVITVETPLEIVDTTIMYLRLKGIALPFEAVAYLLLIGIKSMRKGKEALYLVSVSVFLNMLLDLFLISDRSFSLHMGIQGVAFGYVLSKFILALVSLLYLGHLLKVDWLRFIKRETYRDMIKPIFRIGGWTGADSLTRNLGYMGTLIVLNIMGVNQFGGYGLAMWLMWTLLIPVLALAEATAVLVGNNYGMNQYEDMRKVVQSSIFLTVLFMGVLGLVGVFFWEKISWFFNPNPDIVTFSALTFWWLMFPYVLLAVGLIFKSLFIGTGNTRYILFISLVSNICIVGPFVTLVKIGAIAATYSNVMIQFFIVFVEDLIVTIFFANRVTKRISGRPLIPIGIWNTFS